MRLRRPARALLALTIASAVGCSRSPNGQHTTDDDAQVDHGSPSDDGGADGAPQRDHGGGGGCTPVSDSYTQVLERKVDLLFVVDTRSIMVDQLSHLIAAAPVITEVARQYEVDYHIGFVALSTDAAHPSAPLGELLGSPAYLDNTAKALKTEMKARLALAPSNGVGRGLDALVAALSAPLSGSTNKGFRRADASLDVVALTRVYDHSKLTAQKAATFVRSLVSPAKSAQGRAHALVAHTCCCGPGWQWPSMTALTSGTMGDICATDYRLVVEKIAERVFGLPDQFLLTRKVTDLGSVKITVDGKPASNVTYRALLNSVTFGEPPPAGSTVRVTYKSCR